MTTPLKIKKANPLDFYQLRQPKSCPLHFQYISIPLQYNLEKTIIKWITENLRGRFYVGKTLKLDSNNNILESFRIGFEEPKELSYFTLACPHLKYK